MSRIVKLGTLSAFDEIPKRYGEQDRKIEGGLPPRLKVSSAWHTMKLKRTGKPMRWYR